MTEFSRLCLQTHDFSKAKTNLSDVMTKVVHDHVPTVITRHRGKESMLLMDPEGLRVALDWLPFSTKVSVSEGEFVLRQPELNLIAGGETLDEAFEELRELIEDYGKQYFERYDFFRHTDRANHLPYLLRLTLAEPEQWRAILMPEPSIVGHLQSSVTPRGDDA